MKDDEALNNIAEQLDKERAEAEEQDTSTGEQEDDTLVEGDEEAASDDSGEETETLIVDGEEREESRDELLEAGKRAKQKELAADAKFQEAARLKRDLEERAKHLEDLEAQLAEQRAQALNASSEEESERFADALISDEKKAGEMFAQNLAKQRELESMVAEMSGKLQQVNQVAETQVRNQGAEFSRYYQGKYKDIAENNDLHRLAMDRAKVIRAGNPNLSEFEIIDKSAAEIRDFVKSLTVDKAVDKKRNMQKQPVKAGGRTRGKPALKQETREDVLAQMKSAKAFS